MQIANFCMDPIVVASIMVASQSVFTHLVKYFVATIAYFTYITALWNEPKISTPHWVKGYTLLMSTRLSKD